MAESAAIRATVNDVVMAVCAGGLRTWLEEHGLDPKGGPRGVEVRPLSNPDLLGMFAPESLDFLFTTVSSFKEWDVMVGGSGGSSGNGDNVTVRNTGNITTYGSSTTMLDGTEFDSSYKRGRPATLRVNSALRGWIE